MINWIKVEDKLPGKDKNDEAFSIFVLIPANDKICKTKAAFYDFEDNCFFDENGFQVIDVTHWAYLSDINLPNE